MKIDKNTIFFRAYDIEKELEAGKVLAIFGPRQVGKTTLVKNYLKNTKLKYRFENGGNLDVQDWLGSRRLSEIQKHIEGYELIVIDEAQKVPNIGESLKLIVDSLEGIKVIVTGSASFELSGQIGEPLVGRKKDLFLFPVAQMELAKIYSRGELEQSLQDFLVFGSYPEVLTENNAQNKVQKLKEIVNSYLFKDILAFEGVKNPKMLRKLLALLAFQVGKEVSLNELANSLDINLRTVARYLDLLEKAFVIISVGGYSRNLRKEITKTNRYYFYDNGIMNAIIQNFNTLDFRSDTGALWENFLFIERLKKLKYQKINTNIYFWRTYNKKEIDLVEERDGKLFGFEFKYNTRKLPKAPKDWIETYKNASYEVITPENYLGFVL